MEFRDLSAQIERKPSAASLLHNNEFRAVRCNALLTRTVRGQVTYYGLGHANAFRLAKHISEASGEVHELMLTSVYASATAIKKYFLVRVMINLGKEPETSKNL